MGLNKYYIDGSSVPSEEVDSVSKFIEGSADNFRVDLTKSCSYIAFYDEKINPSDFPQLHQCKIQQLP